MDMVVFCFAGMQSSLLGLALANRFFPDPNVGLPSAISVSHLSQLQ
jgi:predicted Na+-dependent transporter